MDAISKATSDALEGFIALGYAAREELAKRAVKAKPAHDINVRRLNMKPDDAGDYGFPTAENTHGIRVFHDEVKDGRDLPRLMRAVDLAPCMADWLERANYWHEWPGVGSNEHDQFCFLLESLRGSTPREEFTDAARAAGWIE